ncbi:hypothetical protein [Yoonia sp. SS1-5]|uniref:Ferrochelatase n=1 Tax=Yoonia rhodophyticola TaxID=3137370 RepID=A0AAN0MC15_9RHOB
MKTLVALSLAGMMAASGAFAQPVGSAPDPATSLQLGALGTSGTVAAIAAVVVVGAIVASGGDDDDTSGTSGTE